MPPPPPVVVVIEDQPELGRVLADLLGTEGYDVVQVRSASEALAALKEQKVEFMVSDLSRTGNAAHDPLSTVTVEFPDIPVILIQDPREDDIPFFGPWRRDGTRLMLRRPFRLDDFIAASKEIFGEQSPTI